jgi:small subunit ribosomal protein S18
MSDETNLEKKPEAPREPAAPRPVEGPPPSIGQAPAGRPPSSGYGGYGGDRRPRPRSEDGGDRPPRGRGGGGRYRPFFKRKFCKFCSKKYPIVYRDADALKRFITDRGKILPRRITGTCPKHQRALAKAIKQARSLALLPYAEK